jgi:hypothetical protein
MAESPLIDTKNDQTIAQHVSRLSDRAIQRITGGNAFLRGRLYARRNAVVDLLATGTTASAKILVRADQPYETQLGLTSEGQIISHCSCPAWRGPTGHCKHVAAVLVALRDRERPPRPQGEEGGAGEDMPPSQTQSHQGAPSRQTPPQTHGNGNGNGNGASAGANAQDVGTVSAGGKRRRSRRRRRGAEGPAGPGAAPQVEVVVEKRPVVETRGSLDAWLPPQITRPAELEFRLAVRPASIAITTVLAGTRQAVSLADALSGFNTVATQVRPLIRALSRHTSRGTPPRPKSVAKMPRRF